MTEEAVQLGEGGRLLGVLTLPGNPLSHGQARPVFILFNAGLLNRVGPHRLYVRLARHLSKLGFASLRIDLSGKGDSPARPELSKPQALVADYQEIVRGLEMRIGPSTFVLCGLCSGADDAVRLAPADSRAVGMLLLDPICFPDSGFSARALVLKYGYLPRYLHWFKKRILEITSSRHKEEEEEGVDLSVIRSAPTVEQLRAAFESIRERNGRVLSVFTGEATRYYNQAGQMVRVLGKDKFQRLCSETFWPEVDHTYTLGSHQIRLMRLVETWAREFIRQ